jgi:hypothetical protein
MKPATEVVAGAKKKKMMMMMREIPAMSLRRVLWRLVTEDLEAGLLDQKTSPNRQFL